MMVAVVVMVVAAAVVVVMVMVVAVAVVVVVKAVAVADLVVVLLYRTIQLAQNFQIAWGFSFPGSSLLRDHCMFFSSLNGMSCSWLCVSLRTKNA
jgi:hypothetical protein